MTDPIVDPEVVDPEVVDPDPDAQGAWTPPANQAEFDRIIQKAKRQVETKYRDHDSLKYKADQYDALAAASQTDQERAAAEAEEVGFNAAMSKTVPRLVRAEFKAAAKGLLTKEQLETLLEDVDLTRYVDDDGEPDSDKIERKIQALAPAQGTPSFGQGTRALSPKGSNMNDVIRRLGGVTP